MSAPGPSQAMHVTVEPGPVAGPVPKAGCCTIPGAVLRCQPCRQGRGLPPARPGQIRACAANAPGRRLRYLEGQPLWPAVAEFWRNGIPRARAGPRQRLRPPQPIGDDPEDAAGITFFACPWSRGEAAASKARAMWMDGKMPLGQGVAGREPMANDTGAARVREILELFVEIGSAVETARHLRAEGVTGTSGRPLFFRPARRASQAKRTSVGPRPWPRATPACVAGTSRQRPPPPGRGAPATSKACGRPKAGHGRAGACHRRARPAHRRVEPRSRARRAWRARRRLAPCRRNRSRGRRSRLDRRRRGGASRAHAARSAAGPQRQPLPHCEQPTTNPPSWKRRASASPSFEWLVDRAGFEG